MFCVSAQRPCVLGLIPARGGSKRLPGKNVRPLRGRPLIDYAIQAGLNTPGLDALVVTTDDQDIRSVALRCGARAPFLRPAELAQDASSTEEALRHAVLMMEELDGRSVDVVVLLQATAPFTTPSIVQACLDRYLQGDCRTVITVCESPARCEWVGTLDDQGQFLPVVDAGRYFDLLRVKEYIPSGNVYVFGRDVLFGQDKIIGERTQALVISRENAVDIDHLIDFNFAEFLIDNKLVLLD